MTIRDQWIPGCSNWATGEYFNECRYDVKQEVDPDQQVRRPEHRVAASRRDEYLDVLEQNRYLHEEDADSIHD